MDVVQGIRIKDDQVRNLGWLDRAQVLLYAEKMRAMQARHFQGPDRAHCGGSHPNFPMRPDSMWLAVRADGSVASFGGNVGDRLRDQRETIVGRRPVREAARVWDHLPPRREPQQFFIVPEIVLLDEVFLVPRARAAHHERW